MLSLSQYVISHGALPLSVLHLFNALPVSLFLPYPILYLSRCVTSLNSLLLSLLSHFPMLYFSQVFFSLIDLPLPILHLSHCVTSLYVLPLSALYLFLYFTLFKVVVRMTEILTNFL